jgi:tubulin monoglycylase TTLL15
MITNPSEVRLFLETAQEEIFVQEFVNPPHLIHGRKWDIGVYVLITSLQPLRIYVYDDLLLRICTKDFPIDGVVPGDVETYVIADDYMSPWEASSFSSYTKRFPHVKEMLFQYFEDHHKEANFAETFRSGCLRSIYDVVSMYATSMFVGTEGWPDGQYQFFELYRFDFIFDDQLNAFLMEANMSPNLSPSAHPGLSDMFSRITTDIVSLLGLREGPAHRLSLLDDPQRREDSELRNRRAWVPISKDHVYRASADEAPRP